MAAYLIVNVDVRDAEAYEQYKAAVPALIRKHGGEYLVRGGACEALEGDWKPARQVLLRFPDRASLHGFLNDPEYRSVKAIRQGAAYTEAVAVEGI